MKQFRNLARLLLVPGLLSLPSLARKPVASELRSGIKAEPAYMEPSRTATTAGSRGRSAAEPSVRGRAKTSRFSDYANVSKTQPGSSQLAQARQALFVSSDLESARTHAAAELKQDPASAEALFIDMETAALEADTSTELNAALRLCETHPEDERATIAAGRIRDLAANTTAFKEFLPRLRALAATDSPQAGYLRQGLLAAAADGISGLSMPELARQLGLLTDWHLAGPFGQFNNLDFAGHWPPEQDGFTPPAYGGRAVERFRFADGRVSLPGYFPSAGVFYAASEASVPAAGAWRLRVESRGTLAVFVDGSLALVKDDRLREGPDLQPRVLTLASGTHQLLVKFTADGAPFQVTLSPDRVDAETSAPLPEPEAQYVSSSEKYLAGDYAGAIAVLERLHKMSALVDYLLARAWSKTAPGSPEQRFFLDSALRLAPGAHAAQYDLAALDAQDHPADAIARLRKITAARPEFVPAHELLSRIAVRLNWQAEATQEMDTRLRLHPSCAGLREAAAFFTATLQNERARRAEARLAGCAPGSLAYAESLSAAGRHAEAAAAATQIVSDRPFSREAHAFLVRELALAGDTVRARQAAQELLALAPNSERCRRLAEAVANGGVPDQENLRARAFAAAPFYAPYRRDPFRVLKDAADRHYSGGPAVILLDDRVTRLAPNGEISLYVHKLIRVLDRDGIQRYGEVAVPADSDVLELRTIQPDGSVAEPEVTDHKDTVSMPALSPGDVIEQEYVQHLSGGLSRHPEAFRFTFGSFNAPIVEARFVVLWPAAQPQRMQLLGSGKLPDPETRTRGDTLVHIWESADIPQFSEENSMPRNGTLPTVQIVPARTWSEVRDYYRNVAIEAARIGIRTERAAAALRGGTDEEKAREILRDVVSRVRASGGSFADGGAVSAEDTLADRAGSRTAVMLALARAAGLRADLLLARDAGSVRPSVPALDSYTRPLVRLRVAGPGGAENEIVLDAETEGLAFGGLSPTIARSDALLVPIEPLSGELARDATVSLPDDPASEQSVADGDISLQSSGDLEARISIRMGATRAAQMRSILSGIAPGQRQHFFERLALRLFPGVSEANGEVRNEYDVDHPLEVLLSCRAPHFVELSLDSADIDQLVPALGLRKMYGSGSRRFPLYVDAPLFEAATFRLHLPPGVSVLRRPADLRLRNEFGDYSVAFRPIGRRDLEIQRAFRIPVQVVPPERFPAFSQFSLRIDDAERQRLTLHRDQPLVSASH